MRPPQHVLHQHAPLERHTLAASLIPRQIQIPRNADHIEPRQLHRRQADATGVIREILRDLKTGKNYDVAAILARISNAKNAFMTPEEWEDAQRKGKGLDDYDEVSMLVYPRYQAQLRSFQAYDFDDLICEVVRLWQRHAGTAP